MSFVAYSGNTERGIARRREQTAPPPVSPPPKIAPAAVAEPEQSNVVAFRSPRDELRVIVDLVARMHGSTLDGVMSRSRFRKHFAPRQAAICAIKQMRPCMTTTQIGRLFGLDHSSVVHSLQARGFQ